MSDDKEKVAKLKALELTLSKLDKAYGKGAVMKMGDAAIVEVETISTGSLGLDLALGVGGLPRGRVVEIFGPESSGKTTLSQPDNGEQALEIADNLIRSGAIDIVVIDSVAALTPKSEIEGEMGDSKMGLHARLMSLNQLREKIGVMFGNPETTTGGNALKFYASVRLDIRRSTQIKTTDGDVAGNKTRVKVVKNKVAPPFRMAEFDIMYGEGISKVGEIIDIGVDYEIIKKSGSWFSYSDSKLGQGRDAVKRLLLDNPELMEELEEKIVNAIKIAKEDA